jgi:hypothetical protein
MDFYFALNEIPRKGGEIGQTKTVKRLESEEEARKPCRETLNIACVRGGKDESIKIGMFLITGGSNLYWYLHAGSRIV